MNQFRYNLAVSVLFDNENTTDGTEEFPVSIIESPEGKKRAAEYARLRNEIRQLVLHTSDVPHDVEREFRMRLKYLRYATSTRRSKKPTFALLTTGRRSRRRMRKTVR